LASRVDDYPRFPVNGESKFALPGSANETRLACSCYAGRRLSIGGNHITAAEPVTIDLSQWKPPDIATLGEDPFGTLVRYGHALFTNTANEIGSAVPDAAKRFAGNNLTCQNCHLRGGTQPYAMPMMGVWGQFPQYRGREGAVDSLEERIKRPADGAGFFAALVNPRKEDAASVVPRIDE
jgi:hypothetical protein